MQKILSTEFEELKQKSLEAKAQRETEQDERWKKLENNLISSLNSKLEPIEKAIKEMKAENKERYEAQKLRFLAIAEKMNIKIVIKKQENGELYSIVEEIKSKTGK